MKAKYLTSGLMSESGVKDVVKQWMLEHYVYNIQTISSIIRNNSTALGFYYMPVQTGYGTTGLPDFLICFQGKHVVAEAKSESKPAKPSPAQEKHIKAVLYVRGVGFTFNSLESFVANWVEYVDPDHYLRYPHER